MYYIIFYVTQNISYTANPAALYTCAPLEVEVAIEVDADAGLVV